MKSIIEKLLLRNNLLLQIITIINLLQFNDGRSPGCTLYVEQDLPEKNDPLYLIDKGAGNFQFILPNREADDKEGYVALDKGQNILLACIGNKNYLNATNHQLNIAKCEHDDRLQLNGHAYESDELVCHNRIIAVIKNTRKTCFNGGTLLEIGYELEQYGWHRQLTVCHNIATSTSYYAVHSINGSAMSAKVVRPTGRPNFMRGPKYLFKGFNPNTVYTVNNQEVVFGNIVGNDRLKDYIDFDNNRFLSRGHLSPNGDFIYAAWQLNTFFFINAAPQWQSINAGQWLEGVETNVRLLAIRLKAQLNIYTGTTDILKLENKSGTSQSKIYLAENSRIPVPKYFWKIIHNPKDDSCLGIICTNNPYLKRTPKPICKDICKEYRWPIVNEQLSKGYAYCCEYDEMKKVIAEVPLIHCSRILNFPRKRINV